LLRAAAALDAEFPEAAEEALNEARSLWPAHPQLDEVATRLRSAAPSPEASPQQSSLLWVALGVGWLLTALMFMG
jgi:hypothetical protein